MTYGTRISRDQYEKIVAGYRAGSTLQQLGTQYGVTRERIRQILKKFGVTGKDGGRRVLGKRTRARLRTERRERADRIKMRVYGIPSAALKAFRKNTQNSESIISRYRHNKNNAHKRNINWEIDLLSWWKLWVDSGMWPERKQGGAALCRFNDVGPYSPDNCYIATSTVNVLDYYTRKFGPRADRALVDEVKDLIKAAGLSIRKAAKLSGVDRAYLNSAFYGTTVRPQAARFLAVKRAVLNYQQEAA